MREMSSLRETRVQILPGQYEDAETGLHQNWHRDYDPGLGRYLQSDPIGLDGGVNTYGYAGQNPLIYFDFDGLTQTCLPGMRCTGDQDNPNLPGKPNVPNKPKPPKCAETQPTMQACLACCATPNGRAASGDPRSPSPCWDDCSRNSDYGFARKGGGPVCN